VTRLIRIDFSGERAWQALRHAVTTPNEDDFAADLDIVDDPGNRDLISNRVEALTPEESLLIVADRIALTAPGLPLLVSYRTDEGVERVRVVAEELWSIENNISLANMDWDEFVDAADEDGVFRGF
jgi:hypothetical protein